MVVVLNTSKAFLDKIKSSNLVIVHFAADWAEQCKQVDDVLDALSSKPDYSTIAFAKCPAEDLSEISLKYKIEAVPTVLIFKNGQETDRIDGANPAKITAKINEYVQGAGDAKRKLEERLVALINKATVMLFMKGDRKTPRCGFSRQIIEILNQLEVDYETFDILTDEEVRQGLKTFSDWPTYPQLYLKGELLGGLDIIKEMLQSGELKNVLTA